MERKSRDHQEHRDLHQKEEKQKAHQKRCQEHREHHQGEQGQCEVWQVGTVNYPQAIREHVGESEEEQKPARPCRIYLEDQEHGAYQEKRKKIAKNTETSIRKTNK